MVIIQFCDDDACLIVQRAFKGLEHVFVGIAREFEIDILDLIGDGWLDGQF